MMGNVKEAVAKFLETTSMKGIPRMVKAEGLFLRSLWLLGFLSLFACAVWLVVGQVMAFFQYDIVTVIREEKVLDMQNTIEKLHLAAFFAVTICNLKPLPSKYLGRNAAIMSYEEHLQKVDRLGQTLAQQSGASADVDGLNQMINYLRSYNGYYSQFNAKELPELGFSVKDMFVECSYTVLTNGGRETLQCSDVATFRLFSNPDYFNCYILEVNDTYMLQNHKQPYSLTAIMYLDNTEMAIPPNWEQSRQMEETGALLSISMPNKMPLIQSASHLAPGSQTHVRIHFDMRHRLSAPHGDCRDEQGTIHDLTGRELDYTLMACLYLCMQNVTYSECGCLSPQQEVSLPDVEDGHFCGYMNQDIAYVIRELQCASEKLTSSRENCFESCFPECHEFRDQSIISQSKWPQINVHLPFYNDVIKSKPYADYFIDYANITEEYQQNNDVTEALHKVSQLNLIERNFLKFTVDTNELNANSIEDEPALTASTLISQLGGILNLYTGITALLLIESIELLYNIIRSITVHPVTKVQPLKVPSDSKH